MRSRSRAAFAASLVLVTLLAAAPRPSPVSAQGMSLPGSFGVAPGGAATYSIPIKVVPGTAGMVPSLSLEYNSQYGGGLAGVGWSLAGLPTVSRCPQTLAQDGAIGHVAFDANDRFCLDGQRLVAISGTYGADGTEYRTEVDGFSKVISRGSAGTGPAWFEVRTKSGQILEFGNTADAKVLVQGAATIRVWAVSKVSDTKGNYFAVTYINDAPNGQTYPSRIDYTGNASAGLQPYNSVQFVYETRPDIAPLYHSGSLFQTEKRLTNVKAYAGASLVSDYRLTYQLSTSTGRSRITRLELCDGGGNCLPGTNFEWQDGGTFGFTWLGLHPNQRYPINSGDISGGAFNVVDWNGDGRSDVFWFGPQGQNRWYLNNGPAGGLMNFTASQNPIPSADFCSGLDILLCLAGGSGTIHFGDFNGDGLPDMLWHRWIDGKNRLYINTGVVNGVPTFASSLNPLPTGQLSAQARVYLGDFNGDGLTDVLRYDKSNGTNRWYINNGVVGGVPTFTASLNPLPAVDLDADEGTMYLADYNGDGRTDVLWHRSSNGTNRWYISSGVTGGVPTFQTSLNPIPAADITGAAWAMHVGDFNGDGQADVLWYSRSVPQHNRWYVNKGIVSGVPTFAAYQDPRWPNTWSNAYMADWNSDGRNDVVWFCAAGCPAPDWWTNNGIANGTLSFNSYFDSEAAFPAAGGGSSSVIVVGDWNGDGVDDVMVYASENGSNTWYQNNHVKPDVLTSITTGLGATTTITFKPLTDPSVYTKDSGVNAAVFPVVDVAGAAYAVRQVDFSNGIGGTLSLQYSYAGAKSHVRGRGFLGFRQVSVKDLQTNIVDTTTYRQDFPFTGLVASQTRVLGAQTLAQSSNTYEVRNASGGTTLSTPNLTSAPYRVMLNQTQVARNDLNGAALPTVTSTYQYDAYGNATQVTAAAADGFSKTTTSTYSNDTTNWLLGRLTNVTVTSTKP
jgi:hypothetical protein